MAYTTPRTWVAGEYPTAAMLNTHLRDNVSFLANPPACRVRNTVDIPISNNTATALTFGAERWDTDSMHSTTTNTGRITINTAGLYNVYACVEFEPNNSGYRSAWFRVNGSSIIGAGTVSAAASSAGTNVVVATTWRFTAGDYIELLVQQTSGGSIDVQAVANYSPEFGATWVGLG